MFLSRTERGFSGAFGQKTEMNIVLIVGHDRSVPALLKMFGHPEAIIIAASEYDNLFVLVPKDTGPPTMLRLRY